MFQVTGSMMAVLLNQNREHDLVIYANELPPLTKLIYTNITWQ